MTPVKLSPVLLLIVIAMAGCIPLPAVTTTRPQSIMHVYGDDGRPLPGARVVIMIYGALDANRAWQLRTDENGVASLSREKSLTVFAFPWLSPGHHWSWCVEHDGLQSVAGSRAENEEMEHVYVQLASGINTKRCEPFNYFQDIGPDAELNKNGRNSGNIAPR
jgi:hypothetical protein